MVSLAVALLGLLHVAVVLSCLLVGCSYYVTYHYGPINYAQFEGPTGKESNGLTECEASTEDIGDLVVSKSLSPVDAKSVLDRHGAGERELLFI